MKNYIQNGNNVDIIAPYSLLSGEGVLIGDSLFGVCITDIAVGEEGTIALVGVYDMTANTGANTVGDFGDTAYWDNSAKKVTGLATGNTPIGLFLADKANSDASARVRLGRGPAGPAGPAGGA